ncbi:MAG: hypothetical protein PVG35_14085 [Desulfobacterales bacterium]
MFKCKPQHTRRFLHRTWLVCLLVAIGGVSLVWQGCGKKGPPRPPERPLPPAVEDLRYAIQDDWVELSWTQPATAEGEFSEPASIKVFRAILSDEEIQCENCPLRFETVAEIPIHEKALKEEDLRTFHYSEKIDPGYRYIYKVIVFDEYGIGGKNSNVVQFDH